MANSARLSQFFLQHLMEFRNNFEENVTHLEYQVCAVQEDEEHTTTNSCLISYSTKAASFSDSDSCW